MGPELLDQQGKGKLLVLEGRGYRRPQAVEQLGETGLPGEVGPQHHRVDQVPDDPTQGPAIASGRG